MKDRKDGRGAKIINTSEKSDALTGQLKNLRKRTAKIAGKLSKISKRGNSNDLYI